jgi:hypothetical protein
VEVRQERGRRDEKRRESNRRREEVGKNKRRERTEEKRREEGLIPFRSAVVSLADRSNPLFGLGEFLFPFPSMFPSRTGEFLNAKSTFEMLKEISPSSSQISKKTFFVHLDALVALNLIPKPK